MTAGRSAAFRSYVLTPELSIKVAANIGYSGSGLWTGRRGCDGPRGQAADKRRRGCDSSPSKTVGATVRPRLGSVSRIRFRVTPAFHQTAFHSRRARRTRDVKPPPAAGSIGSLEQVLVRNPVRILGLVLLRGGDSAKAQTFSRSDRQWRSSGKRRLRRCGRILVCLRVDIVPEECVCVSVRERKGV